MTPKPISPAEPPRASSASGAGLEPLRWEADAEEAMNKVPFFSRGAARRAVVALTRNRGLSTVTLEIVQDAKARFPR